MKKPLLITLMLFTMVSIACAQTQPPQFAAQPNGKVSLNGDLSDGTKISDLSWAWNSQNACFVENKEENFTGNHVLYQTEIPPHSEMTIRVIPADRNANFSVYAYSGGRGALPPNLRSCVSCEADYKWDYKYQGKSQGHSRRVQLRAVNNPYPVTIGVVGAAGLSSGAFTLEVELEGGENPQPKTQAKIPLFKAESQKGKALVYQGDLSQGELMHDLSWAWSSQNACFPEPRKDQYQGHHQLYVTELNAQSELVITLVPDDPDQQLSLYAYSFGGDLRLVPNLSSCVSCEAGYQARAGLKKHVRQVELRAVTRPYRVVIGVAGAEGVTTGAYQLELNLK